LLHEDEDMMAFKHLVIQKNGKKYRVAQIQLYKDGKVWREISNAIDTDQK
jgi:predicted RecB family nuclease